MRTGSGIRYTQPRTHSRDASSTADDRRIAAQSLTRVVVLLPGDSVVTDPSVLHRAWIHAHHRKGNWKVTNKNDGDTTKVLRTACTMLWTDCGTSDHVPLKESNRPSRKRDCTHGTKRVHCHCFHVHIIRRRKSQSSGRLETIRLGYHGGWCGWDRHHGLVVRKHGCGRRTRQRVLPFAFAPTGTMSTVTVSHRGYTNGCGKNGKRKLP